VGHGAARLSVALALALAAGARAQEGEGMDRVEAALSALRGDRFRGDVTPFVEGGRAEAAALERVARALREERGETREEVARLVVALGVKTDPLAAQGAQVIRDERIVAVLVKDGLARADPAKDVALDALRLNVPVALLRPHTAALLEDLRRAPDASMLLVLARLKPAEAPAALDALEEREPAWATEAEMALARIALGDVEREQALVDEFEGTLDPDRKAALARDLGRIATEGALRALAASLRSDLIVRGPYDYRSVRLDILGALVPSFLEEPALLPHRIVRDDDYARAEAWAERRFGITWDRPRPAFLTHKGVPEDE
jgi:hypothetical protein